MREIYFDNAASTKPDDRVIERFANACRECYGNPSSLHDMGLGAEKIITDCKKNILTYLNVQSADVIFTSGATESNNLAILGYTKPYRKKRVITSKAEHPSVTECFKELESRGIDVVYLNADKYVGIDMAELESAVNDDTLLVSLCHVNSETGCILDIETAGRIIKQRNRTAVFHVDAAQSFGKMDIAINRCGIDMLSLSSHKFYGPKGVGALAVRTGVVVQPMIFGGRQQKGTRSGTENTYGIAAMNTAVSISKQEMLENYEKVKILNAFIREKLRLIECVEIHSNDLSSPYILSVSFLGVRSEIMLHALEQYGIYVSSGSACSSKAKASAILKACGLPDKSADSAIRLSFSAENTVDECEKFITSVNGILPELRR